MDPREMTGAQALIKSLEMQRVEVMFGLPGGAILPVYDPIIDSSIRHILVRHEQGAGHMAEGYAMVTGKPGVAMVTSGPGATNIVTPLANAYMDSTPLMVLSDVQSLASGGGRDAWGNRIAPCAFSCSCSHCWLHSEERTFKSLRGHAASLKVGSTVRPHSAMLAQEQPTTSSPQPLDTMAPVIPTGRRLVFATAVDLRASFIDHQGAPAVDRTVQGTNSISRLCSISHLDECKSPRLTRVAIRDGRDCLNCSVRRE